jgi:hypothetical protein
MASLLKRNRNTLLLLSLLVGLLGFYFLFIRPYGRGTVLPEESQFSVADTTIIESVTLTVFREERATQEVRLQRLQDGTWQLNDSFPALPQRVSVLLESLRTLEMTSPVNDSLKETALERIRQRHVRVEVGIRGASDKVFYISSQLQGGRGSFGLMQGYSQPYVVGIRGFQGYPLPRFEPDLAAFRANVLFSIRPENVRSLGVEFHGADTSFTLQRSGTGNGFRLASGEAPDTANVRTLLGYLGPQYALRDAFEFSNRASRDSLRRIKPDALLRIELFQGSPVAMRCWVYPQNMGWMIADIGSDTLKIIQNSATGRLLVSRPDLVQGSGRVPLANRLTVR